MKNNALKDCIKILVVSEIKPLGHYSENQCYSRDFPNSSPGLCSEISGKRFLSTKSGASFRTS